MSLKTSKEKKNRKTRRDVTDQWYRRNDVGLSAADVRASIPIYPSMKLFYPTRTLLPPPSIHPFGVSEAADK